MVPPCSICWHHPGKEGPAHSSVPAWWGEEQLQEPAGAGAPMTRLLAWCHSLPLIIRTQAPSSGQEAPSPASTVPVPAGFNVTSSTGAARQKLPLPDLSSKVAKWKREHFCMFLREMYFTIMFPVIANFWKLPVLCSMLLFSFLVLSLSKTLRSYLS